MTIRRIKRLRNIVNL